LQEVKSRIAFASLPVFVSMVFATVLFATTAGFAQAQTPPFSLLPYKIDGDSIALPLVPSGNARRGEAVVLDRALSSCVLCHVVPDPEKRPMGNIGPPLAGAGARLNAGQLRLRMVDSTQINPQSIMPPYYRIDGLHQVAPAWRGKPILNAQQIEDVVAYLLTLKDLNQ
jgi:sulfur-oxidizing protein SoxX